MWQGLGVQMRMETTVHVLAGPCRVVATIYERADYSET